VDPISPELIEQCLGVLEDRRVEAFGEPGEDRSEKLASLLPLTLVAPEPRHARGGAEQLPKLHAR